MVRVAVTGATGRMGQEVISAAANRADLEVVLAVSRDPPAGIIEGVEVTHADDLPPLLADREPNVLVDFTAPDSSLDYVEAAADAGVASVVGTTGFDDDHEERLAAAANQVPVLVASNFSRGVAALRSAVQAALPQLPGYDVEVTETHHNGKRDAPSGTATTLLGDIEAIREAGERVHGREGDAPRSAGEIGVHARRAGNVTGEHEVLVAGNHEVLELTHRAGDRGVFAEGALDAAEWLAGREPGAYDFMAVLAGDESNTTPPRESGGEHA